MTSESHHVLVYFSGGQRPLSLNLTNDELVQLLTVASQQSGVFYTQEAGAREYIYGAHIQRIQDVGDNGAEVGQTMNEVEISDLINIAEHP